MHESKPKWRGVLPALLVAGVLTLAACAPAGDAASSTTLGDTSSEVANTGDELGDTLNLATWPNYHDPAVIEAFTAETGVNVNVNVFGSTEEMEALLRAGNSGIDIVVPTHYAVPAWIEDGLIQELDYAAIGSPDLSGWNGAFVDQVFDPGNRYTIPKNWGTTGIIFGPDVEPVTSWTDFFDRASSDLEAHALIVDHQISTIGSAAVAMGYDLNTTDPDELAAIEEMLVALKPHLWAISSDVQPPLRNGDTDASMAWTGDGVQVVRDNPEYQYVIPDDGGELWVDNWSIASDAPHLAAANAFMEFILRPENSAADTEFILFPHANPAVLDLLPVDVAENPVIYPEDSAIERMTLSSAEAYNSQERAEMWARVKASS